MWALEEWRVNGRGYKMWEGAGEWAWLPGVGGACLKGPSHLELLGQVAVVDFNQSFPGVETGGALRAAACFLPTATALWGGEKGVLRPPPWPRRARCGARKGLGVVERTLRRFVRGYKEVWGGGEA